VVVSKIDYVKKEFRQYASVMYPDGLDWGGQQHRDCVRMFVAGAFAMDRDESLEFETFVMDINGESWSPDDSWNWNPSEQN